MYHFHQGNHTQDQEIPCDTVVNTLAPGRFEWHFRNNNYPASFSDVWPRYLLWNYAKINITGSYWWQDTSGLVIGRQDITRNNVGPVLCRHIWSMFHNELFRFWTAAGEWNQITAQIAKFMGPIWGRPVSCRPQMGPMLAPWTLLSGSYCISCLNNTPNSKIRYSGNLVWCV